MIEKMSGHIPYWMCYGVEGPLAKHFDFSEEHYKVKKNSNVIFVENIS